MTYLLFATLRLTTDEEANDLGEGPVRILVFSAAVAAVTLVVAGLGCGCAHMAARGRRPLCGGLRIRSLG